MAVRMTTSDYCIVGATVLGPILAVQAQKWVEVLRERRNRKLWVFQTLMATRATRIAPDHVQALNMIDLAFYGGPLGRTEKEQAVLDAWKVYLNHLTQQFDNSTVNRWSEKGLDLFLELLYVMSKELNFKFDRVQLQTPYCPRAHGDFETWQASVRTSLTEMLNGNRSIKMEVASLPTNPEVAKLYKDVLSGVAPLKVKIERQDEERNPPPK